MNSDSVRCADSVAVNADAIRCQLWVGHASVHRALRLAENGARQMWTWAVGALPSATPFDAAGAAGQPWAPGMPVVEEPVEHG
jgi:hypothetical protein